MATDQDFVMTLLSEFCRLTGKLTATCADYALATDWESTGMPLSIALRGLEIKIERGAGKKWLRTMPLSWCEADVIDEYTNWRRAVGPHAVRASLPADRRLAT